MEKLASISCKNLLPELKECSFRIACDVDNPLYGEKGCSYIFGPQKGATPEMVELMDGWMEHYAKITEEYFADSKTQLGKFNYDPNYPGCGAAGGLGFAFRTFLHGKLEPGISIVLEEIGIENQIKNADIVITGEGRLDGQTVMGKAPIGIARLAKKYGKLTTGGSDSHKSECVGRGYTILPEPVSCETELISLIHKKTPLKTGGVLYNKTTKEKIGKINKFLVYSFWVYNKSGELLKRHGRNKKMEEEHPFDPIDPIQLYYHP